MKGNLTLLIIPVPLGWMPSSLCLSFSYREAQSCTTVQVLSPWNHWIQARTNPLWFRGSQPLSLPQNTAWLRTVLSPPAQPVHLKFHSPSQLVNFFETEVPTVGHSPLEFSLHIPSLLESTVYSMVSLIFRFEPFDLKATGGSTILATS